MAFQTLIKNQTHPDHLTFSMRMRDGFTDRLIVICCNLLLGNKL